MDPHSGRPGYYGDGYHYSFKGQPSWLTVKDTSLVGTVPKIAFGNHQVTVSYRSKDGKRTGETVYILTTDVSSSTVAGLTSVQQTNSQSFNHRQQTQDNRHQTPQCHSGYSGCLLLWSCLQYSWIHCSEPGKLCRADPNIGRREAVEASDH
mgnify:CR=1 FL=1